ncbi:fructosamine kinase family protein [Dactylosporangium sp. CA-092794]|uniref:fructosamine kinase family protein n=1 Tax=Dactylosporangium sp. CA-092794 TaxID=3239929 RepID=UPI003D8A6279
MDPLRRRLRAAGLPVAAVTATTGGGAAARAGIVTFDDGSALFAKTVETPVPGLFEAEAEGLRALRDQGGVTVPDVYTVAPDLLLLSRLFPRPIGPVFWERLGRMLAALHLSTRAASGGRFGWHRDGFLGRMRQENAWNTDGHRFFAERRLLRWLPEPLVAEALSPADRAALERFCAKLPDLIPAQPPVLTHGDLRTENVLAAPDGGPALIDPAVSYGWPETDLSVLWCSPRPPESQRCFAAYAELAPPAPGWRDRMRPLYLHELLSTIAHGDDTWGAATLVREILAPFRPHAGAGPDLTPQRGQ